MYSNLEKKKRCCSQHSLRGGLTCKVPDDANSCYFGQGFQGSRIDDAVDEQQSQVEVQLLQAQGSGFRHRVIGP